MTSNTNSHELAEAGCNLAGNMIGSIALAMWTARATAHDPDELEASMLRVLEHVHRLSIEMPIPASGLNTFSTEIFVAIAQACDLVGEEFRTMIAGEGRQ